jgi:hypothetical protein
MEGCVKWQVSSVKGQGKVLRVEGRGGRRGWTPNVKSRWKVGNAEPLNPESLNTER